MLHTYLCPFRTKSGDHYLAQVEEYQHHLYVIKFYLKKDRHARDPDQRFQRQTNRGAAEALRVIHTCLHVMLAFIARDPLASCGFIGSPKPDEDKRLTQRFRIYTQLMKTYFPDEDWQHRSFPAESAYLLLNRRALAHTPDLLVKAGAMFDALYLMPDTLRGAGPPETAGVG